VNVDRHVAGDLFSSWADKLRNPLTRTPDRVAHFKLFWFILMYCYSFFFGCADAFSVAYVNAYTTNCFVCPINQMNSTRFHAHSGWFRNPIQSA
jgi:hypothetical protein